MPSIAREASSFHTPPHSPTTSRLAASQADSESSRTPSRSKMTASIKRGTRESNPDLRFWRPPSSPLDQSPGPRPSYPVQAVPAFWRVVTSPLGVLVEEQALGE